MKVFVIRTAEDNKLHAVKSDSLYSVLVFLMHKGDYKTYTMEVLRKYQA